MFEEICDSACGRRRRRIDPAGPGPGSDVDTDKISIHLRGRSARNGNSLACKSLGEDEMSFLRGHDVHLLATISWGRHRRRKFLPANVGAERLLGSE